MHNPTELRQHIVGPAIIGFLLGGTAGLATIPSYSIEELPTLGGSSSLAFGINSHGAVVGQASLGDGSNRAVIWDHGVLTDLGTLGGDRSQAFAINDQGFVTGRARNADGRDRAYIWDPGNGSMTELPTVGGMSATNADDGTGFGINASNTIAGHARNAAGQLEAFSWSGNATSGLGQLGGSQTRAWDINEAGQIAGWGSDANGSIIGFRWSSGVGYELIGELQAGDDTFGIGINDSGDVVGSATASFRSRAWRWDGTSLVDLGEAPGFAGAGANHLNNHDQVVGLSYQFDGSGSRIDNTATLWQSGLGFNLNDHLVNGAGWYLQNAYNINDAGQIVGWGTLNGETRGFVLTPIPEPATLSLLSAAVAALRRRA